MGRSVYLHPVNNYYATEKIVHIFGYLENTGNMDTDNADTDT